MHDKYASVTANTNSTLATSTNNPSSHQRTSSYNRVSSYDNKDSGSSGSGDLPGNPLTTATLAGGGNSDVDFRRDKDYRSRQQPNRDVDMRDSSSSYRKDSTHQKSTAHAQMRNNPLDKDYRQAMPSRSSQSSNYPVDSCYFCYVF